MGYLITFRQLLKCLFLIVALSVVYVFFTTKTLITFQPYHLKSVRGEYFSITADFERLPVGIVAVDDKEQKEVIEGIEDAAGGDAGEAFEEDEFDMMSTGSPLTSDPREVVNINSTTQTNQQQNGTDEEVEHRRVEPKKLTEQKVKFQFVYNETMEKEQKRRKELINKVCRSEPELQGNLLYRDTYAHIYVNDRYKLLFCYIPKVGCSNWKRVLMLLAGKNKSFEEISSREAHSRNGLKVFRRLTVWEQQYALKVYRKVMFVRQPFSRILSAYKNKYGDLDVYRNAPKNFHFYASRIIRKYRENPTQDALLTGENITFSEFVEYLTDQRERPNFDRHWKEMYKLCSPCKIKYDFVGKLETLDTEANYVLGSIPGARDIVSYPAKSNSHPTNTSVDIVKETLSPFPREKLSQLWNIYKLDFALFGYDKPDFIP